MSNSHTSELLSDVQLAALFNVSVATVRKWRVGGKGPRFVKIGACVRYRRSDAEAFLDSLPTGGGGIPEAGRGVSA